LRASASTRANLSAGDKPRNVFKASSTLAPHAASMLRKTTQNEAISKNEDILVIIEALSRLDRCRKSTLQARRLRLRLTAAAMKKLLFPKAKSLEKRSL
jgi:hypothetical protein